mmetsp:Transcript_19509/g.37948  ORF Transcript_19509/g.37948 Transcript_19509/m.37948 type:complete len:227 (+) Transcript_19509:256-936(+)
MPPQGRHTSTRAQQPSACLGTRARSHREPLRSGGAPHPGHLSAIARPPQSTAAHLEYTRSCSAPSPQPPFPQQPRALTYPSREPQPLAAPLVVPHAAPAAAAKPRTQPPQPPAAAAGSIAGSATLLAWPPLALTVQAATRARSPDCPRAAPCCRGPAWNSTPSCCLVPRHRRLRSSPLVARGHAPTAPKAATPSQPRTRGTGRRSGQRRAQPFGCASGPGRDCEAA